MSLAPPLRQEALTHKDLPASFAVCWYDISIWMTQSLVMKHKQNTSDLQAENTIGSRTVWLFWPHEAFCWQGMPFYVFHKTGNHLLTLPIFYTTQNRRKMVSNTESEMEQKSQNQLWIWNPTSVWQDIQSNGAAVQGITISSENEAQISLRFCFPNLWVGADVFWWYPPNSKL